MLIKKKSLIVALVSSFVISAVLVSTFIGYVIYIEIKGEEFKRSYEVLLQRANAKVYSKYLDASKLEARIEIAGALKGKAVIEGVIKNKGQKNITDLLVKVNFLDRDGAVIYEVTLHPQEPSLGSSGLTQVTIPYLSVHTKIILKPDETLPFKRILFNCPKEIRGELKKEMGFAKGAGKWSGKFSFEVLAVNF